MRFHVTTIALLSLAASSSEDMNSLLQTQGAKSLDGQDCLAKKCEPNVPEPVPSIPVAPPVKPQVKPAPPAALTKDEVVTGIKQIIENGGECLKGDFKTLKAMGSGAHTIRASVTIPRFLPMLGRQWILNLGQMGTGANHWLWSPVFRDSPVSDAYHVTGDLQFGRWNGGQIRGVSKGVTNDQMMKAASLTTTFDGKTYSLYIDGQLKKTTVISPPLDIKTNNLRVGLHGKQPQSKQDKNKMELDFSGCVTKVEVWDSALTSDEVAGVGEGHHNVVAQPVVPPAKPQVKPAPPVKPPVKLVAPPVKPPVKPVAPPAKPRVRLPPSQFNVVPDGCTGFKSVNEDCTNKDLFILKENTKGFVAPTFKPDQYDSDDIWEVVKVQDSEWKATCVAYVSTGGGSCKQFCESNGMKCVRAMDDAHSQTAGLSTWLKTGGYKPTDCTLLPSLHGRQDEAENGCNQRWGTQMCACN